MYKVFAKDKPIFITDPGSNLLKLNNDGALCIKYKSKKNLHRAYELLLKEPVIQALYIVSDDVEHLWKSFKSLFQYVEAAGGVVKNTKGEILLIFRKGKWDLPKGKVEKGESIKEAALREVEEECGIRGLSLTKDLASTYHTYSVNGKSSLKKTYWFEMVCASSDKPKPQLEEEITKAEWLGKTQVKKALENTYPAIIELMMDYF